jgi:hypothetical protein
MSHLKMSWGSLLDDIDDIGRRLPFIYFAAGPASDEDLCLVVDEDAFEGDEDVPTVAERLEFTHELLIDDVQQVIENLRQQDPTAPRDVLMRAIAHYVERDAFIDITG